LYRGDPLPSCYGDWVLPERERLRQAYVRAVEGLIILLGRGDGGQTTYVHQIQDTYGKMKPEVMGRACAFAWTFIRTIDARDDTDNHVEVNYGLEV